MALLEGGFACFYERNYVVGDFHLSSKWKAPKFSMPTKYGYLNVN